jgi:hypothetical protein
MDTTTVVVSGLVGFGCGLSKDIIFSWLKGGREHQSQMCSDHQERMARMEERLDKHDADLSSWESRFDLIFKSIRWIETSVAVLLDRAKLRREGEDGGNQ